MAKFRSKNRPLRVFKPSQRTVATGQHLLSVDSLADDGRGIAHVSNKTVFVTGALAGEQVKARYISSHKNYDEAVAVAIVEAAEQRVMPVCEYVGRCGGCDLQHLNYDAQLAHKQQRLSLLFSAWLENDNTLAAQAITGSPLLYRH